MIEAQPILQMTDVQVRYGSALALSDLSLSVPRGSVLAVVGPNGAGKSTIARAVSGLIPISSGTITFDGRRISKRRPDQIRKAGLVHLPEGRGVFTGLSVAENLRMAAAMLPRSERKDAIDRGYDLFDVLGQRRRQTAGTLSGGEQQMVSLARALILDPTLIVADELSLGLAPLMVDLVFEGLARAREQGVTIVLIEQFVHRALAFADDCAVISRGRTVWSGPARDAKNEVLRRYLGAAAA
jgi:branched-chain amino acid transport system ATP-binding protein